MYIGFRCIKLRERDEFENIKTDGRIILKETDAVNGMRPCELDWYCSGDRQMLKCTECGN
jgi:hypothetical protein